MQTQCPHCNTIFSIQEADLEQANGQVRCGHCFAIFTADGKKKNPVKFIKPIPPKKPIREQLEPLPEVPVDTKVQLKSLQVTNDVIPPALRKESREDENQFELLGTVLLTLGILIGIMTLIFQYAYYNLDSLAKIPPVRPALEFMCNQTGCSVPLQRDLDKIVFSSKNIYSHPKIKNALVISATIVNKASFPQNYPIIEWHFVNIRGKAIFGRRFNPMEYLKLPENEITKMLPNKPVSFKITIKDPGREANGYEFLFL